MSTPIIKATLHGTKVGLTWGSGVCTKDFEQELPYRRRGQLLHALKRACDDGDFQYCRLHDDSVIEVRSIRHRGNRLVETSRVFSIEEFPSAKPFIYTGELP